MIFQVCDPTFKKQLEKMGPKIQRSIANEVKNKVDVDDIWQESYVKVLTKKDGAIEIKESGAIEIEEGLTRYMVRVAKNVIKDRARRDKKQDDTLAIYREQTKRHSTDPYEIAFACENAENAKKVLTALKVDYETVLRLKYFEGLTYDDIADAMGKSNNAVTSKLNKAKSAFKKEWRKRYPDWNGHD